LQPSLGPKIVHVFKEKHGFGPRIVYCKSSLEENAITLDPFQPVPEDFKILRNQKKSDSLCLESGGLLGVTLKFQISDKKALNVKTKGRQFSVLYKVEAEDFKNVLNLGLTKGLVKQISVDKAYGLGQIQQVFSGSINNVSLKVSFTYEKMGDGFTTDRRKFLKVLSSKFLHEYFKKLCIDDPTLNFDQLCKDNFIEFFNGDWFLTNGLGCLGPLSEIFTKGQQKRNEENTSILPMDVVSRGREKVEEISTPLSSPGKKIPENFFNSFADLPFALTLLTVEKPSSANLFSTTSTPSPFEISPNEFNNSVSQQNYKKFSLILENRTTNYQLVLEGENGIIPTTNHLTFSYYEDGEFFERVFVSPNFLSSCL
jgi:hypothetical protein